MFYQNTQGNRISEAKATTHCIDVQVALQALNMLTNVIIASYFTARMIYRGHDKYHGEAQITAKRRSLRSTAKRRSLWQVIKTHTTVKKPAEACGSVMTQPWKHSTRLTIAPNEYFHGKKGCPRPNSVLFYTASVSKYGRRSKKPFPKLPMSQASPRDHAPKVRSTGTCPDSTATIPAGTHSKPARAPPNNF